MKILIMGLLTIFAVVSASEEMKAVSSAMHGNKMVVDYTVLNNGKHVLIAKEGTKELQTVDLNVKEGELVSISHGFKCKTQNPNDFVYAVISKKNANEKSAFAPVSAWVIEEKKLKIKPFKNAKAVSCIWSPDGESKYPF